MTEATAHVTPCVTVSQCSPHHTVDSDPADFATHNREIHTHQKPPLNLSQPFPEAGSAIVNKNGADALNHYSKTDLTAPNVLELFFTEHMPHARHRNGTLRGSCKAHKDTAREVSSPQFVKIHKQLKFS